MMLALVVCFQNCSIANFGSTRTSADGGDAQLSPDTEGGNGSGYEGKPSVFRYFDPLAPCVEQARNGSPLPNKQIYLYTSGKGQLVRDGCADIKPVPLSSNLVRGEPDGTLVYAGLSFAPHTPVDMEVFVADCPAGLSPRPGAVRTNLINDPLDPTTGSFWGTTSGGVAVAREGVFAGQPAFSVTRLTANENERRLEQFHLMQPNATYAASFFMKKVNGREGAFHMYDGLPTPSWVRTVFSLETGVATVLNDNSVFTGVSMTSRPIGDGFFFTVYFTTSSTVRGGDLGYSSAELNVGDAVIVANPQLELVSNFCQ